MYSLAFEGDFIETNDGFIFDVKGFLHPKDRKIAYLRYIPASSFHPDFKYAKINDGKKIKQFIEMKFGITVTDIRFVSELYVKLYDIPSRFKILTHFKPHYIFNSDLYDIPLQSVPIQDIKKIHAPEEFLVKIFDKSSDISLKNLIKFLCDGGNIHFPDIGLSGSSLVGLEKVTSDYDILIYGKEESQRVHNFLESQFSSSNKILVDSSCISKYSEQGLRELFKVRGKGFDVNYKDFSTIERRKTHQFVIDGKEVFIRFIEYQRTSANLPQFENFSFKSRGRISLTGIIVDDSKSFFTPGRYSLKILEIASENYLLLKNIIEIFTLRGRFLEQARIGDNVYVRGKLEEVTDFQKKTTYQRIIIGTDPNDLMIYRNRSKEKFN